MIRKMGNEIGFVQVPEHGVQTENTTAQKVGSQEEPKIRPAKEDYKDTSSPLKAEHRMAGTAQEALVRSHWEDRQSNLEMERTTFKRGNSGPEVLKLQKTLNDWLACNGKKAVTEDGLFGPDTERAIKEFQAGNGLKADGLVGPKTKEKLRDFDNKFADDLNVDIRREKGNPPELKPQRDLEHQSRRLRE